MPPTPPKGDDGTTTGPGARHPLWILCGGSLGGSVGHRGDDTVAAGVFGRVEVAVGVGEQGARGAATDLGAGDTDADRDRQIGGQRLPAVRADRGPYVVEVTGRIGQGGAGQYDEKLLA